MSELCINPPPYLSCSDSPATPRTDAEAEARIYRLGFDSNAESISATQVGLYRVYRAQDLSVIQSYERALLAFLNAYRERDGKEKMEPVL